LDRETIRLLFRDDGLSDLIGFQYQHWQIDDALNHFVAALDAIAQGLGHEAGEHTVLIALDGENAWEYYPNNGWDFLEGLYRRLSDHPRLEMRRISDAVVARLRPAVLTTLRAGSWVQGNLATWIGSPAKNRAWEALIALKKRVDEMSANLSEAERERVAEQLAICEASDWFWWFADHNPAEAVAEFDQLFRDHLKATYALLGVAEPQLATQPFATGGGAAEMGGTMQRAG
jgi:alpha-amylase/alpha-mannosidase (GH57 family)